MQKEERTRIELNPEEKKETKNETPTPVKQNPESELTVRELEDRIAPISFS
jgi:hypothetical protein